jgi:putative membrane protein
MKPVKPILPPTTLTHRSLQNRPSTETLLAWLHWLLVALFAAAFLLELATLLVTSLHLPGSPNGPEVVLLLLATASTIFALERQLPMQNVLLAVADIALIGGGISTLGATSGIPFGPFTFTSEIGPELFNKLPWAIPLVWIVTVLNSRGVARLILRPWRKTKTYGYWLMGLAAVLTMLFILAFDPFAARIKHYWFWTPVKFPLTWQGAPLVDFLSWGIVTLLILAFITPALIGKRMSKRSTPDFHPLCVWLGGILIFGIACAQNGLWPATAVDAAIGIVTIIFAVRGARW